MYCQIKDENIVLSRNEANWNFIWSSSRMCVEKALDILKGRLRLIIK